MGSKRQAVCLVNGENSRATTGRDGHDTRAGRAGCFHQSRENTPALPRRWLNAYFPTVTDRTMARVSRRPCKTPSDVTPEGSSPHSTSVTSIAFLKQGINSSEGKTSFLIRTPKTSIMSAFTNIASRSMRSFSSFLDLFTSFSMIRVVASLIMEKTARGVKSLRHYFHSFTSKPRQFSPPTAHDTGDGGGHAD